jgi:probable FeS assembly SUF system protein SufT
MNDTQSIILLQRDVDACLIPSGAHIFLQQGTEVTITQALGSSYTVNIYGNLARIDGKDADALGKDPVKEIVEIPEGASLEEYVWKQMKLCFDPEIPVNIVDLGLIYDCRIDDEKEGEAFVYIKMTLTAPGCGMGPILVNDVKHKIKLLPGVKDVDVEMVFDPPWDRDMMSDEAKLQLGML